MISLIPEIFELSLDHIVFMFYYTILTMALLLFYQFTKEKWVADEQSPLKAMVFLGFVLELKQYSHSLVTWILDKIDNQRTL